MAELILASRSPQRAAILAQLGISFSVRAPGVDEREEGPADEVALQNARGKAGAVATRYPDALVLGADTVVCLGQRIYGKPASATEARDCLEALSGQRHVVIGGLCLIQKGQARTAVASTAVRFRVLAQRLIDWYVNTGEWRDRAGGYAIQGAGSALVAGIEGDYSNVVGLSVPALLEMAPGLLG